MRVFWAEVCGRGGGFLALVEHDVVALVDARARDAVRAQRAHDHFRVLVARESGGRADDGPVHVAGVVEHGTTATAAADEVDGRGEAGGGEDMVGGLVGGGVEEREVDFEPGVLVAADDNTGAVGV